MRVALRLIFALFLVSVVASRFVLAQTNKAAIVVQSPPVSSSSCPVSLHARQRGGAAILNARKGEPFKSGRVILLTLEELATQHGIQAATITVQGTSGKQRVVPARDSSNASTDPITDKQKVLNLTFSGPSDASDRSSVSANLELEGFTSVTSIRLESLTYADGSRWTSAARASCRTVPDPLVLLNASIAPRNR